MIRILSVGDRDDEGREVLSVDHDAMSYQAHDGEHQMPGVIAYRNIMFSKAKPFVTQNRDGTGAGALVLAKYNVTSTVFGDQTKELAWAFVKEEYNRLLNSR